jgi:hypothetical protein
MHTKNMVKNPEERDNLQDLGVDGSKYIKLMIMKKVGGCGLDSAGSGQVPVVEL